MIHSLRKRSKVKDFFMTLLLFGAMAAGSVWLAKQSEVTLQGQYKVIDGDSLVLNGQEIRLLGIDAPEYRQTCTLLDGKIYPCGKHARTHLSQLVKKGKLECKGWEEDKYQRLLAVCTVNEVEINVQMVMDGWAVSYGDYESEERVAKERRLGVWRGGIESPSSWRERERGTHSISWLSKLTLW